MRKRKRKIPVETFTCPTCGADVPTTAPACPECGADDETGWSEDSIYDEADLPDDFADKEPSPAKKRWGVIVVVTAVVLLLIYLVCDFVIVNHAR